MGFSSLDEDNTDNSLSTSNLLLANNTKEEPSNKRPRRIGPMTSTSEEEYDVVALPPGIEEQYGFKINPVSDLIRAERRMTLLTHI